MSKPLVLPALTRFVSATAGRNMTTVAYVAVMVGVAMMTLLTVEPAYDAAPHWVDALLWACLAYFIFEWLVRLRHMRRQDKLWFYALSSAGVVDAIVAEDIGKFPDLNLAESLQRIPGVVIARDAGEGRQISVRGLGPDFTRVRINGMEALTTSARPTRAAVPTAAAASTSTSSPQSSSTISRCARPPRLRRKRGRWGRPSICAPAVRSTRWVSKARCRASMATTTYRRTGARASPV